MDRDAVTGQIWGLEPVPGYINPVSKKPAINTDPLHGLQYGLMPWDLLLNGITIGMDTLAGV
jgi:hypothetical protein